MKRHWPVIEHILIFSLTFLSVTLVNLPTLAWAGPFFGLAVQPLWMYRTYQLKQWGMLGLAIWFTFAWGFGCYHSIITW